MKGYKKLFCAGNGATFRWLMASSKEEATNTFGTMARLPDPDDIRRIWTDERLYEKSSQEIQEFLGISRQALSQWRIKAGVDLPTYRDHTNLQKREQIKALLSPDKTPKEIADEVHVAVEVVKELAEEMGVKLANKQKKKPDDEEIVRLSQGRTWRQLAEVCNVTIHTLRHYVYARPALAERLRSRMVYEVSGSPAHGRVDVDELVQMYESGESPYQIAKKMGVENLTIIYWLKKLEIYKPDAA